MSKAERYDRYETILSSLFDNELVDPDSLWKCYVCGHFFGVEDEQCTPLDADGDPMDAVCCEDCSCDS